MMDDRFGRGLWRNAGETSISARVLVRWSWVALGGRLLVAPVSPYHFLVFGVFGGFSCGFWFRTCKLLALWILILERNSAMQHRPLVLVPPPRRQ